MFLVEKYKNVTSMQMRLSRMFLSMFLGFILRLKKCVFYTFIHTQRPRERQQKTLLHIEYKKKTLGWERLVHTLWERVRGRVEVEEKFNTLQWPLYEPIQNLWKTFD